MCVSPGHLVDENVSRVPHCRQKVREVPGDDSYDCISAAPSLTQTCALG